MGQLIQFRFPVKDRWGYGSMSKFQLLEEMIHFQEDKVKLHPHSRETFERAKCLFTHLQRQAETPELRSICQTYLTQLENNRYAKPTGME